MMNQLQIQKCIEKLTSICSELEALPIHPKQHEIYDKYRSLMSLGRRIVNIHDLVFEGKETEIRKGITNLNSMNGRPVDRYYNGRFDLITSTKKLIDTIEILFIDRD
jgi:hypothetical protein